MTKTNRITKPARGLIPAVLTILVSVLAGRTAHGAPKPKAYPDVQLSAGSQPRYSALAMDPWKSKVAYVLFDGNRNAGYRRVYVWIPEDPKYGQPQAFSSSDGSRFGPFQARVANGQDVSQVAWIVSAQSYSRKGGTHTRFDYATGKQVTVEREGREGVDFSGTANYARGNQMDMAGESGFPLDITVGGDIRAVAEWKDVGEPGAPWEHLHYRVRPQAETGGDEGRILLKGSLNAKVRALPEEDVVEVQVRPYREDPLVRRTYGVVELARGVDVTVPYGWYRVSWTLDSEWLKGRLTGTTDFFTVPKPYAP